VLGQADGGYPEPWSVPAADAGALRRPAGWDSATVTEAAAAVVAADQAGLILAMSTSAARLLGYDDTEQLVGSRIVSIVPERLQQAHVAGFTMYQLVGRRPLLDRPVVVPALRRDGSEVMVELLVHEEPLAEGRAVLHAELRLAVPKP
jgi:PAS domain S-box-containing protein